MNQSGSFGLFFVEKWVQTLSKASIS